jgi:HK97 gp10 family phage protein
MAERIDWYGNRVFTLATEANIAAMHKAAILVADDTKEHFTKQGSGRIYGKRKHRASKPGEPPAIDTGTLRASIMSEVERHGSNVLGRVGPDVEKIAAKAPVGTNVNYGYYLEIGTSKMAPRPYLRPALIRTRKKVVRIFKEANS